MTDEELQRAMNNAFIGILENLCEEKFITKEQCVDLQTNYSVVIENKRWLPKFLSDWMGMKDDNQYMVRLARMVGRKSNTLSDN